MIRSLSIFSLLTIALAAATPEIPILFERHAEGRYRVRGNGYGVAVDGMGMTLATTAGSARLTWLGSKRTVASGENPLRTRVNYLTGSSRAEWRTGIETFGRILVPGLYPGVDVVYYGTERQLEYDFVVRPGGDAGAIRFQLPATMDADGSLRLHNGLRWAKPVARQDGKEVAARFVARGAGEFAIAVGAYDRSRELVIDPVLSYGTYIGGTQADEARAVAVDAAGNAYVVGSTVSVDFPGTNRGQTFGGQDAFVAKLNPSGRALEWATYIGGTGLDVGMGIAVDTNGGVYVTGHTASTNFPVTPNAPQSRLAGGSAVTDSFILKLDGNGSTLIYSTYLGGSLSESATAITIDATGAAYAVGRTDSTDFPSTTKDTLPARGAGDGYVTKIAPDGGAIVYSSFIGGFALDVINAIVLDSTGAAYVTGETRSDNFPVTDTGYQRERKGSSDAFFAKLSPDGAKLVYASYYGGDGQEIGRGIAIDRQGNAYIAGVTVSSNIPISPTAAQPQPALLPDAFAAKIDPTGSSLLYGTYLGGSADDQANAITVDANGTAYIAGQTNSANFPIVNDGPLPSSGPKGGYDGFLTRLSSGGNFIQYSTLYGGTGSDSILGLATDGRGRFWLAGATDSTNLPTTTGALATAAPGAADGFVALMAEISVSISPTAVTLGPGETQQFTAVVSNTPNTAVRWSIFPETGTMSSTGLYTAPFSITGSPTVTVSAISLADGSKVAQALITLNNRVAVSITPATATLKAGERQQFTATVAGTTNNGVTWSISPAVGTISSTGLYTAPASFLNEATITVKATSVADTSRSGTATVQLVLPPPPPLPSITAESVTNAASFRGSTVEGGISPGEFITVFGTNIGPATPVTLQLDGRGYVSNRLANTRVLFDGTPGPMIMTSSGQVSAVAPYELEGKSTVTIQVEYEGRLSPPATLPVAASAPAIFTQNSTGSGPGSIIRQNGELVTAAAPAAPGEVLTLYGTGEGATNPTGVDGKPTTTPLPIPRLPVKVVIDGVDVEPLYAGGAPSYVAGLLQVNFVMPPGVGGNRRIRLRIGDKLSPDTVTVPGK